MELELLRLFQRQVDLQCQAVLIANAELERALEAGDTWLVWIPVQNLLTAAANVSKALWGTEKTVERRAHLRETLSVNETSPLRPRTMRNNFEHYDERLECWWETGSRNYLDMWIAPLEVVPLGHGHDLMDVFRVIDPVTRDVIFWGQRFNLPEIVAEAARIQPIASALG